jgi:replicative DNA helicase
MAIQERLSMVVLAQLNKQPGNREDGEPIISDLRDCGMIGADASDIILVWAPTRDAGQQSRYIKVAKNRHGPTIGKLELEFRRNSGGWLSVPDRAYETGREYQS